MGLKTLFQCVVGVTCALTTSLQPLSASSSHSSSKSGSLEYIADYVIVGAGTGGCVVAARLAEAGHSVIIVEAGPDTSLESNDILVQFDKALIEFPLNFIWRCCINHH